MKVDKAHIVFFIGIGGIGMSALARWFNTSGKRIFGYDKTETNLTRQLESEGIDIIYTDSRENLPIEVSENLAKVLVIYTPAIPVNNDIFTYFKGNNATLLKRSEVLGQITLNAFTLAIAGTHGKTTTSSILAHIIHESDKNSVSFIGGVTQNYGSNIVINKSKGKLFIVVEADEYDRSFLQLTPNIAVITALDADHLDIYGDEEEMFRGYTEFIRKIKPNGTLVIKSGLKESIFPQERDDLQVIEYSMDHSIYKAGNLRMEKEEVRFDYIHPEETIQNIPFSLPGFHNVENAIAAITVSKLIGIDNALIKSALSNFRGIKRRFEYILYSDNLVYIDDYAHHPAEIKALLSSIKAIFTNRKITVIFQPHLFSRTRDFANEFAQSLALANEVILLNIYPAREKPIEGVTSKLILDLIGLNQKEIVDKAKISELLEEKELEVLVTIGAGDIDQLVNPIKQSLIKRYELEEN